MNLLPPVKPLHKNYDYSKPYAVIVSNKADIGQTALGLTVPKKDRQRLIDKRERENGLFMGKRTAAYYGLRILKQSLVIDNRISSYMKKTY